MESPTPTSGDLHAEVLQERCKRLQSLQALDVRRTDVLIPLPKNVDLGKYICTISVLGQIWQGCQCVCIC